MRGVAAGLALALVAGPAAAQQAPAPDSLPALVARGDSAWAREAHPAAFAAYDAVVRADSAFSPRALYRVGLLHAWANRFGPAIAAQRRYLRSEPTDIDGRIALARTFAWASRFPEAIATYDTALTQQPASRDATLGKAQALAWSERIADGASLLEAWLTRHETDAEAWTLLGQIRRWRGELRAADAALTRALAIAPDSRDAREQMAWVHAELAPAVSTTLVGAKDSEGNVLWHRELGLQAAGWGNSRVGVTARLREATVDGVGATQVPGATVWVQGQAFGRQAVTRLELGAVQFPAGIAAAATRWRGALRVGGSPRRGLRLSGGAGVEPFDEVRAGAERALMFAVADLDASYALATRWQLGLSGSVGAVGGESLLTNSRHTAMGALRFLPWRGTQLALTHREVTWQRPAYGVFFAPQRWATTELSLAAERRAELGLLLAGDVGIASQLVGFEASPLDHAIVPRATMRVGYRVAPGRELLLGLTYANVAGAGAITASDYRYGAATLGGRWTF